MAFRNVCKTKRMLLYEVYSGLVISGFLFVLK